MTISLKQRLERRVRVDPDGCWVWQGWTDAKGYGQIRGTAPDKRVLSTHRAAYELFVGPIPDGMQIDHLCRNTSCCNPAHLEPVDCRTNLSRSPTFRGHRTHCPQGHAYDEVNTYTTPEGFRRCRTCVRIAQRKT